jgi:hypothetical protein
VSPSWGPLAWRGLPVILVLAWFLVLIGGYSAGGAVHLLLLAALAVFGYQLWDGRST